LTSACAASGCDGCSTSTVSAAAFILQEDDANFIQKPHSRRGHNFLQLQASTSSSFDIASFNSDDAQKLAFAESIALSANIPVATITDIVASTNTNGAVDIKYSVTLTTTDALGEAGTMTSQLTAAVSSGAFQSALTAQGGSLASMTLDLNATTDAIAASNVVTVAPTATPTTPSPTESPTQTPTRVPSLAPTLSPTASPTTRTPTITPTQAPTAPTKAPTDAPTKAPTNAPTKAPTEAPSIAPSLAPSIAPTDAPTTFMPTNQGETFAPSDAPTTFSPSNAPSFVPSSAPTSSAPTTSPSVMPTLAPTREPTLAPTFGPSKAPTLATTESPTGAPISLGPTYTPTTTTAPTRTPTSNPTIFGVPTPGPTTAPTNLEVTVSQQVNLADMDVDQVNATALTSALETMSMDAAVSAGMNFSSASVVITSIQHTGSSEELIQDSAPDAVLMESAGTGTSIAYSIKYTGHPETTASHTDLTQLTSKLDDRASRSDSSGLCSRMATACVNTGCPSCTTSLLELSAVLITSAPTGAPTNLGDGSSSSGLSSTQWGWLGAGIFIWACVIGLVVVLLVLNCRSDTQQQTEQVQGSASEPLMSHDPVQFLPRTSYDQLDTPAEDTAEEQL